MTADLDADLAQWDASRERSGKTSRARARGQWGVGPSDASNPCPRQIMYRERPPADFNGPLPVKKNAAVLGTIIHGGIQAIRKELYPQLEHEVSIQVPGLDVPGSADEVDREAGRVLDIKTCGSWTWDRVQDGPREGDVDQVHAYALGLEDQGMDVRVIEILYIARENGASVSYEVPYNRERARNVATRLAALIDALDSGADMPRGRKGPTTDIICRDWCEARDHCWPTEAAALAGRTPESMLTDDEEVHDMVREYVGLRVQIRSLTDALDVLKARLDGHTGLFEGWKLSWVGGGQRSMPDWETYATTLTEILYHKGVQPPGVPEKIRQTARRIDVRRAAK